MAVKPRRQPAWNQAFRDEGVMQISSLLRQSAAVDAAQADIDEASLAKAPAHRPVRPDAA